MWLFCGHTGVIWLGSKGARLSKDKANGFTGPILFHFFCVVVHLSRLIVSL